MIAARELSLSTGRANPILNNGDVARAHFEATRGLESKPVPTVSRAAVHWLTAPVASGEPRHAPLNRKLRHHELLTMPNQIMLPRQLYLW